MSYQGAIKGLLNMLHSDDRILRKNAIEALCNASNSQTVRDELVYGEDRLKYVLEKLNLEYDHFCLTAGLNMLFNCLRGGLDQKAVSQLLKADGVISCLQLTNFSDVRVKEAAAQLLCLLALSKDARKVSVGRKAVVTLLDLLKEHQPILVQAAGAAALMSLTINVDAKKQMIDADGVALIPPLIIPEDEILCLNILQLLTNMGEHPKARMALEQTIPELRKIIDRSNSAVLKRWARYGIQQLLFKHRPFTWEGV